MLLCPVSPPITARFDGEHTQLNLIQDLYFAVRASRLDLQRVNPKLNLQKISLLTVAVERNSVEIVQLLLEQGCDVNIFSEAFAGSLETPLFTAVKMGHTAIVHLLLHYGADPNLADFASRTPLFMAVQCNREEEALALIMHGANLNFADKMGITPLQAACRGFGREMLAFYLVNHGAYVHQADFKGRTAVDLALVSGNICILQMLLNAGAAPGKALSERMTALLSNPEESDFCAELALRERRRTPSLQQVSAGQIRKMMIERERLNKTGRSIWRLIDRLPIPETLKLDSKIFVHINGFNN